MNPHAMVHVICPYVPAAGAAAEAWRCVQPCMLGSAQQQQAPVFVACRARCRAWLEWWHAECGGCQRTAEEGCMQTSPVIDGEWSAAELLPDGLTSDERASTLQHSYTSAAARAPEQARPLHSHQQQRAQQAASLWQDRMG